MLGTSFAIAVLVQAGSAPVPNTETWEWDPKVPICTLRQTGTASGAAVTVERTPGGEETELDIVLPSETKVSQGHFLNAVIRTDSGEAFAADISSGRDSNGRPDLYVDSPDPEFIKNLSGTAWLEVSHPKLQTVRVPIHVPAKIVATLHDCEDTSMRDWGIDAAAWRGLKSRPFPLEHVRERFSALDYPASALAANVEADAVTRLDIGNDGSVVGCATLNPGLPKVFESASCKVLIGAKFRPATDANGKPTNAPIVYDVRFRLAD